MSDRFPNEVLDRLKTIIERMRTEMVDADVPAGNEVVGRLKAILAAWKPSVRQVAQDQQTKLIGDNLDLADLYVSKYSNLHKRISSVDEDDVRQTARLFLAKAAASFDPTKEVRFRTYASRCIERALNTLYHKVKDNKETLSLNATVNGEEGEMEWEERVVDESANIEDTTNDHLRRELGRKILAEMNEEDRQLVMPILEGKTFAEVAQERGCTRQNVHIKFWKIMGELRKLIPTLMPQEGIAI